MTDDKGGPSGAVTEPIRTDWQEYTHPTTAVVEQVADATDHEVTALPSLHESVDMDGLEALLTDVDEADDPIQVSFSYCDLRITVRSDQTMLLRPDE